MHKLSSYAVLTLVNSAFDALESRRFDEMRRTDEKRVASRAQFRRMEAEMLKGR
jgi:hypothetical protein